MAIDLPPKLWLPQKPAIIRAASRDDLKLAMPLLGTFAAASVRGLKAAGGLTEVLIDRTLATAIGDMTGNGAQSRFFDGNQSDPVATAAYKIGADGYGGANYAATHVISKVVCYGMSDQGFQNAANGSVTLRLFVKVGTGATPSDTAAGTVTFTDTANNTPQTITCTVSTPVQSFVVKVDTGASGSTTGFGEIQAYEWL